MKLANLPVVFTVIAFVLASSASLGADEITLELKKSGSQAEVGLRSKMALPVSAMYPEYTIQRSMDLANWETVAGPIAGSVGVSDEFLRVAVPTAGDHAFYRVIANVQLDAGGGGLGDAIYEPGSDYIPPNYQSGNEVTGDNEGSDYWDALVTDVHTDPPDVLTPDPGSILHEGIGNVQLLMIAVDCGLGDTAVYAGPVLSHYEFELGPTTRLTDSQWKIQVRAGTLPPQPEWTRGYLVPKP